MVQGDLRVTGTAYGSFNGSFTGNLNGAAARLGSGNIGSGSTPIYLAAGVPTECSSYGGGSLVNLNGSLYSGTTATFYAPSSAGTLNYVLVSNGNGAPSWKLAAPIATAVSNNNGSTGASKLTITATYDGVALDKGTAGTANYYGASITSTGLSIGAGASAAGSTFTAAATTLSGTLSVSGDTTANRISASGHISTTKDIYSAGGNIYTTAGNVVKAAIYSDGNITCTGRFSGNIQDYNNASGNMRIGWNGTAIQSVTADHSPSAYSSLSRSSYLVSVYVDTNADITYYKDVRAENVTVGNALACSGYTFVVGSFGNTSGTMYFV